MKAIDVEIKMITLQKRIQEQEERLPALRQSLQPYLQVQRYLRLAAEPPPMVEQWENSVEMEPRKPLLKEQIRHEPEHRKKRASDLSL